MQMSHRSVACPMGERKTFHPRRVCQSWQYPRGHTTAHLYHKKVKCPLKISDRAWLEVQVLKFHGKIMWEE